MSCIFRIELMSMPRVYYKGKKKFTKKIIINFRDNQALIHLIKMNVGIGVMALPSAFYNSGMAVGIAAMVFMASITVHCMHLLVSKQPFLEKRIIYKSM